MLTGGPSERKPTKNFGYLVIAEQEFFDLDLIVNALADSISSKEGVGQVLVECLGEIETTENEETAPEPSPIKLTDI